MISPDTRARCLPVAGTFQDHFVVQAGADEQLMVGNEEETSSIRELGNLLMGEGIFPVSVPKDPLR